MENKNLHNTIKQLQAKNKKLLYISYVTRFPRYAKPENQETAFWTDVYKIENTEQPAFRVGIYTDQVEVVIDDTVHSRFMLNELDKQSLKSLRKLFNKTKQLQFQVV